MADRNRTIEVLYGELRRVSRRFRRSVTQLAWDLDDLVHDVVVKLLSSKRGLAITLTSTYLETALRWALIDLQRAEHHGVAVDLPDGWPSPEDDAFHRERELAARELLDRLSLDDQTVLSHKFVNELNTKEGAAALGIAPGALRVRVHRALARARVLARVRLGWSFGRS